MKPQTCPITDSRIEDYAENHTSPESAELNQLNRWVHLHTAQPRMISGAYQGKFLEMISSMIAPKKAVEVGSFVGYSTVCLAKGVAEGGVLHAIEVNEEFEDLINHQLDKNGVSSVVTLHIGDAKTIIPHLEEPFDLAFIDADKPSTDLYYELLLPKMKKGGFLLIDNILWSGKVVFEQPPTDKDTPILKAFNDKVQNDPRVENVLLPIRDGLMLCKVL